jgi:hypothetical protein
MSIFFKAVQTCLTGCRLLLGDVGGNPFAECGGKRILIAKGSVLVVRRCRDGFWRVPAMFCAVAYI